jgi:hypothetical protein
MNLDLGGENFEAEKRAENPSAGEEENKNALLGCVWVHPQNGLIGLILNWCTGSCWFTPAAPRNAESGHPTWCTMHSGDNKNKC